MAEHDQGGAPESPGREVKPDMATQTTAGPSDLQFQEAPAHAPPSAEPTADQVWYYSQGGRSQEGPVSFADLKAKAANGHLATSDFVWREGMPEWQTADSVPDLFGSRPATAAADPASASPIPPAATGNQSLDLSEVLVQLSMIVSSPSFLRICGLAAGILGVLVLIASVALWWFRGYAWFTSALVLLLAFVVCQSLATLADRMGRLEASLSKTSENETY
jgi:hypothetical protein